MPLCHRLSFVICRILSTYANKNQYPTMMKNCLFHSIVHICVCVCVYIVGISVKRLCFSKLESKQMSQKSKVQWYVDEFMLQKRGHFSKSLFHTLLFIKTKNEMNYQRNYFRKSSFSHECKFWSWGKNEDNFIIFPNFQNFARTQG